MVSGEEADALITMMLPMKRGMRTLIAVAVLGLSLASAGCTGDGEARAFTAAFGGDPIVESMELTSHDNQPFTGGVSGDVFVNPTATDDEFLDLTARVGDYTREHAERMRGQVSLDIGGLEMAVTGDQSADDESARLLVALRSNPSILSGSVDSASASVESGSAEEAIELARELPALMTDVASGDRWHLGVRDTAGSVSIAGDAAQFTDAMGVWDAIGAEVPLAGIRARRDERMIVALRHESDLGRARAVPLDGGAEPAFESDLVQLGESDGADARQFLENLAPDERARIAYVWISDVRVQIAVHDEADLVPLVETVDAALPPRIAEARLVWAEDVHTRVEVREPDPAG